MITTKQFREAMVVVENYCDQVERFKSGTIANEIGCRVQLSAYGKEMQRPHAQKGTVVDWLRWSSEKDGLVTVKWDGVKKPDTMHVSQVEALPLNQQKTENNP